MENHLMLDSTFLVPSRHQLAKKVVNEDKKGSRDGTIQMGKTHKQQPHNPCVFRLPLTIINSFVDKVKIRVQWIFHPSLCSAYESCIYLLGIVFLPFLLFFGHLILLHKHLLVNKLSGIRLHLFLYIKISRKFSLQRE